MMMNQPGNPDFPCSSHPLIRHSFPGITGCILTQYPSFTDAGALGKYGLCPLYTPDTGFANVWLPVIRQFNTIMPVRIGSVQYLAGMFFIIKDA